MDPARYHGNLFPIGDLHLSLIIPTIGVAIPSVIYPDKKINPIRKLSTPTISYK